MNPQFPVLNSHYPLTAAQIAFFRDNGFIKLKNVLSPATLDYYGRVISAKVIELNTLHLPMEQRTTYQKAFLQIINIWRKDDTVREFVFGHRLARIAAELMGTTGVKLYHDQALYKEAGGGITPWHADQYYWPLSNENTCTAWIPLQATPLEMGPLEFSAHSHQMTLGRDLEISDESERAIQTALANGDYPHVIEPFDLGEVSFHYGWTFHHAAPNTTPIPRRVMTIIYMDEDMRRAPAANKNQEHDRTAFLPETEIGEIIHGPLTPLIWSGRKAEK